MDHFATARARLLEARAALTETEQGLNAYRAEPLRTPRDRGPQAGLKLRQLAEEGTEADKRNELRQLPWRSPLGDLAHSSCATAAEALSASISSERPADNHLDENGSAG